MGLTSGGEGTGWYGAGKGGEAVRCDAGRCAAGWGGVRRVPVAGEVSEMGDVRRVRSGWLGRPQATRKRWYEVR
jgi:hypothetical protein